MSEETPVKSYYVQLPGYDKGEVWDEAKYNRNKENLFNDHKDAMVVETSALSPEEDITGEGMYTVHLPGFQKAELWDSDKLSRNRDALLRDHPDVEISRTTPVNYWGDRLKDNYDRVEALREELKGLPEPSVDMNISDADALAAVQDTPERRRRAEINRDIDQLLRDRENNPAYKAYWDDQKKSLASDAQRSKDEAKRIRKEDGRNLETDYYNLANRFYNDALKTANAPSKYDDSKTGFGNFVRGVGQNMMSAVSLLEFAKSLDSLNLVDTVRQVQKAKGDEADLSDLINNHPEELDFLTNGQREMLKAFVRKAEVESGRADNMSVGYNAGRGAIQSAGFMADFLLTGGVGDAAASAATRKLGLQASKDIVAKGLGQQAKKLAIGNLEGAVKALAMTPMMPSSYSNFINNLTTLNEDGQMDLGAKAVLNSVGDVLIENFSENAGELFGIPFEGKLFDAISKSQLGNIGRALGRTNTGTILRQAGFHGLVGEMAEEVLGNAMRSVTGIDKDALSNFFQKDEFLTTLASFAPMTVLGGIGSTASAVKTYRKASKAGSELEKILSGLGMDEEKIRELMDLSEADSPQLIGSYVSEIGREAIATGKVTRENFRELGTALGNYTIAQSNLKVLKGVLAEEDDVRRAQDSAVIDGQTGTNRWWHRGEDGNGYVRTITDADGNESFVISEMDGELALVDRNGQRTFMSAESLANGIESGALTDSGEKAINEYLDNIEDTRAQMAEAERMNQERAEQVSSIQSRLEADPHINMGTDESPVNATVTGLDQGGVVVEWDNEEGHQMQRMSWDEAGQYLGTPVEVKTDDQIEQEEAEAEEEIAERRTDYNNNIPEGTEITVPLVEGEAPVTYQFKRAFVGEDGNLMLQVTDKETGKDEQITEEMALQGDLTTVLDSFKNPAQTEAEETETAIENEEADDTLRDFRGNPIPLKDDGTVNQTALWNDDPEAWARWNDGQRQDGGANSRGYIAKAVKKLQSDAKAIQKQIDEELDFDKIERLEKQLDGVKNRIADLTRIEANYTAAEAAAVAAQEAETSTETAPVMESKREETPVAEAQAEPAQEESPRVSPEEADARLAERFTSIDERLGQTNTPEEYEALMQEKRQALEEYYEAIGTEKPHVTTRATIVDLLNDLGCSPTTVRIVSTNLANSRQLVEGFRVKGQIVIIADDIRDIERARLGYVHERQHGITRDKGYASQLLTAVPGATRDTLLPLVNKMAGADYSEYDLDGLADEVVSLSMEIAYDSTPENLEENLRKIGLDIPEIINFVKSIDDEQRRNGEGLSLARRNREYADGNTEASQPENGGDLQEVSGGILDEETVRPEGSGGSRAGSGGSEEGAGEVTPPLTLAQQGAIDYVEGDGSVFRITRLDNKGIAANGDEVRFSVKYSPQESEINKIAQDIADQIGVSVDEAERWVRSETSLAAIITGQSAFLDYEGDDRYTAIKQDSDYPQGTVDFNNICRKRLAFTEMYQRVQKAFPYTIITGEDLATIRNIMREHDLIVACGLCYVEDRRQLLGEIAKDFIDNVRSDFSVYESRGGETKKKNAQKFRNLIGEDRKEDLSIYDLITLEGSAKLLQEHPGLYQAFQAFNNARGQQSGNLFQGYAEYKREILKWSKKKVKSVNDNGGLRIFSYSDFEAHHLIDLVQIIQDCARKGVKIQGYTKVPAFARAVANTGIKLNRSLIPLGDTGIVDGKLAYDSVEGIDINDPNFLQSNDNIGNILIGINDEQIRLAMADPFIHFIIPYHSNQKDILRSMKQTGAWTNYKLSQTDKDASGKTVEQVNIYTDVLNAAEAEGNPITNERQFTEKFLAVCKERGLTPRFAQFLNQNENGDYVYTPGYYKFLVDFKLFDEQGRILPQEPVRAEFDDGFNAEILDNYVKEERAKLGENLDDVFNEIVDKLGLEKRDPDIRFRKINATQKQPGSAVSETVTEADAEEVAMFRLSRNNKATVESWIGKRDDLTDEQKGEVVDYIDKLDDAKTQLATARWFANGTIRIPEDMKKVQQAISVAGKAKVDPLRYKSPMELLDAHAEFKPSEERINPDEVSTLHRAAEYPEGIVVYDVDDTEESRKNMRDIINSHFGEDASPWCLLQGDGKGKLTADSKRYWRHYNAYPKQVAFKDGKLLAFSANDTHTRVWWDRQDEMHYGIPVTKKVEGDALGRSGNYILSENPDVTDTPGEFSLEVGSHLFKGNRQNGLYEEWNAAGDRILERTNYKNGKEEGLSEVWYPNNGQMERRCTYKDGNYVGTYEAWFDNGRPRIYTELDDEGMNNGVKRVWNREGVLQSEGTYDHGKRVGDFSQWDDDGNLLSVMRYDADGDLTVIEEHDEFGIRQRRTYFGEDGQVLERFSRRGQLLSVERTEGGKLNGLQEQYYLDGTPDSRVEYTNGERNGLFEKYHPNGQLWIRGQFKDGKKDGVHESWSRDGVLNTRTVFKDDEVVEGSSLDALRFRKAFDSANEELGGERVSVDNPDLMREYGLSNVTMTKKGDLVTLNKVVVADQKKGNGTRFMNDLTSEADNNGWTLALTPDDSFGATSVGRLKKFYKRFGFKDNKGRNADLTVNESMIRQPEAPRFRLSNREEMDREYMAAVEAGDMDTAQRMVDEAAVAAGFTTRGYHQTNSKRYVNKETGQDWDTLDWNEREEWEKRDDWDEHWEERDFYTFDRRNARTSIEMPAYFFAPEEDPYHEYGDRTIDAYLKLTNPVINPEIENAGVTNDAGEVAMRKYIAEGYDGFIREEDGQAYEYGVFDASQIKSAEPVTYDDEGNVVPLSKRFDLGNDDIRFRKVQPIVDESNEELFDAAKKRFGTTRKLSEAGYVLPDGAMLDFSGRHLLGKGQDGSWLNDQRTIDHREIQDLNYLEDLNTPSGIETDMSDFIRRGAIRLNTGVINLATKPTKGQENVLWTLISRANGNVDVDFGDGYDSDHYASYDNARPERILNDIRRYFDEGVNPEGNVMFRKANQTQNGFISNAEAALDRIKMDKATPEQWIKMLEKEGGLKAGEDKWLGLSDWLKESDKKTITKDEIGDFIEENRIQIEEVRYGGSLKDEIRDTIGRGRSLNELQDEIDEIRESEEYKGIAGDNIDAGILTETMVDRYGDDFEMGYTIDEQGRIDYQIDPYAEEDFRANQVGETRPIHYVRQNYTTAGLENNREIALTVPTIEPWNESDEIHFGDAGEGRAVAWTRFGDASDAEGNKVLVIDEIQSKRHQEARERGGYKGSQEDLKKAKESQHNARKDYYQFVKSLQQKYGVEEKGEAEPVVWHKLGQAGATNEEIDNVHALYERWKEASEEFKRVSSDGVPAAPFEKNWHELAMKRMLRLAAEEGYDKVAWTTGEQQAERYNIGGVLNSIERRDSYNLGEKEFTLNLNASGTQYITTDEEGNIINTIVEDYRGKTLSDLVGKELAIRMLSMKEGDTIQGDGLRVGGEGMKGFYDDILPRFMNKYGKKWGVKVGTVELQHVYDELGHPLVMHSVDVTPEMKESVMEGQVMFSKRTYDGGFSQSKEDFDSIRSRAIAERGLVSKGLYEKRIVVAQIDKQHPFNTSLIGQPTKFVESVKNYAREQQKELGENNKEGILGEEKIAGGIVKVSLASVKEFAQKHNIDAAIRNGVDEDTYLSILYNVRKVIRGSVDCEVHPDYRKGIDGQRTPTVPDSRRSLVHEFYAAVKVKDAEGELKDYRVNIRAIETQGRESNKAYVYEIDEIEIVIDHPSNVPEEGDYSPNTISIPIANLLKGVEKSYDPGKKLLDAEYLDAVESGDMEKARQMVREAAALAMPDTKVRVTVYHGTKSNDGGRPYNTILSGHFTDEREFAEYYAEAGSGEGYVYDVFLNITNPLEYDLKGQNSDDAVDEEGNRISTRTIIGRARAEGYDGVIIKNVDEYGSGVEEQDGDYPGTVTDYIPLSPNQVKSAEPVTYDDNGEVIPLSERFNPENDDIRFSLRGIIGAENAEDEAALDNLEVAEDMEKAGKDSQTIWKATGWERGADGKWRNEIPDARQKEGVSLGKTNVAGEVIDAPELFASYPDLKAITIELIKSKSAGAFNEGEKRITLDKDYNTRKEDGRTVLNENGNQTVLHELQHAIQEIEGFARGGNKKQMERQFYKDSMKAQPDETLFAWLVSRFQGSRMIMLMGRRRIIDAMEKYDDSKLNLSEKKTFRNILDRLMGMDETQFKSFVLDASQIAKKAKEAGDVGYNNLAGEVEARNVERRFRILPEKDRKNYPPEITEDVLRSEQVIRFRKRTKEDPKETIKVYKLMRLEDGKKLPLFIDRNSEPLENGQWYDADSPDLAFLKDMPSGIFLVDADKGTYTSLEDYQKERGAKATKWPTVDDVNEASSKGLRWMKITDTGKAQRRYEGENRKYENIGINGSEGVSTFAMRPGWHAGSLPTMRQIGKGAEKNIRDDKFVWVEGEIPADIDYNEEAQRNPDKDIPTHIPTDGYYLKATNADKAKSQADRVGWYVAGAFKPNRVIGDLEARQIIDDWNAEHPDAKVEYDWPREGGRVFNAETMRLEEPETKETIRFRKSQNMISQSRKGGLAGVIGEEDAAELYRDVYRAIPGEIRQMAIDKAGDSYIFTDAVRDMISEAVETEDETGIAGLAANMLRNYVGDLDERTVRYILWRGTRKEADDDLIDTVNDIAMQRRLQVGEFANPVMFRLSDDLEEAQNRADSMADDAKATMDEKKEDARENDALTTVKAMSLQKEYDRKTVNAITVLARNIIKDQNIDTLNRREIARLLGIITTSVGKAPKTVKKNADALMGLVVDHLLRSEETKLGILTSRKASKVNAAGVEVQGELDVRGQNILKAYKAGLDMEIDNPNDETDENTINGRLAILSERLSGNDDALRSEAEDEYAGLMLAKEYLENVKASVNEERGIRNEIKAAEEDLHAGKMSRKDFNEFIEEANNSIRENKVERIEAYRDLAAKMRDMMAGSIEARKAFTEREKARVEEIHHLANSDMQGRTASPFRESTRLGRLANSSIVRFFAKPLATFDQMLRLFGGKNVAGEGYLWNKFHRGWIEADENAYLGEREAKSELDAKVSEVFGKEMRWSDLYAEERKMPTVPVKWWDDGEMREHELTQGNLLYIYMVNKMTDGRMKLRRMGITQDIVDRIARQMDSRFIELADWLQSEYLVQKRNKYNAVHERLFGASMAAIEDYFPLKINKRSLNRAEDIGRPEFDDALPATTTGSIVKRKRNSQDLDLAGADAFSVVIEHIEQMEQWAAFAEFNKDLNTLLSYKRFRNQVQNMASVYGSGRELWNNFKSVCRIAGGTYNPAGKKSDLDTAALNIAKGVTAAKISFRVYTALKQFLSMPAFVSDANIKYLAGNIATPWKAWNWAMENLPMFEKRWMSRMAGDTRLMKTESDWKLWRNNIVEKLSRWGMSPNGFVDALTVSIGSRSMYQTRYDRYIKDGYTEEQADKKAKQDATTLYNETQQSNESAFVAPVQLDRTVLSTMLTVFRNSSMGYQRQLHDAIRNIGKMMRKGYKAESVEFMKRQMIRDGLTEEQAEHAANRNYNREIWRSAARVGTFGFLVQFAWNLGGSIAYLLFGDDDDKKEEMLKEAAIHGLIGGSMEGLAGGNVMSEALNMVAKGESLRNYDPSLLPIVSDLKSTYKKMSYDPVAGANDLVNLAIQAGIGVNPQTLTDAVVAVVDACGGDLDTSKEAMLLIMRVLQVPQSQVDQIYIDELDMTAGKARTMSPGQMAERYARYKVAKGAPLTGWAYSDEAEEKREKAYLKSFNKKVKERKSE